MRLLLTGANGQLGREVGCLLRRKRPDDASQYACPVSHDVQFFSFSRQELDVTNRSDVMTIVKTINPDVIVNAAAYTKVDEAEKHVRLAYAVNSLGAKYIAEAACACEAKLCYISTDYVFDGERNQPYECSDVTNPQTVYGRSKRLGEEYVQRICAQHFIVRTSWLYGSNGSNFVHTMLELGNNPGIDSVQVVCDQTGSPTWTYDLACRLADIIQSENYGVYHISNTESTTWYGFAKEIFRLAHIEKPIIPVLSSEFLRPARRPAYSVLGSQGLIESGLPPLRPWHEALQTYLLSKTGGRSGENH